MSRFDLIDVFGASPFSGNPLAVVHDAGDLSTDDMLAMTRWFNLSETTFLVPPTNTGADYRVRIFTPSGELPFAGHPTLGTCCAWLAAGGQPASPDRIVQECGVGLVPLRRDGERLAFAAPDRIRSGPLDDGDVHRIAAALGLSRDAIEAAEWGDNGPGWQVLLLRSAEDVLDVELPTADVGHFHVGLVGPHKKGGDAAIEVRAFFNDATGAIREDPVTGSLNAAVGQWLLDSGRLDASYVASQGTALGRSGRVYIDRDAKGVVWVGGATRIQVQGSLQTH